MTEPVWLIADSYGPMMTVWFAVSICLLGVFDIALPRGDTLGVSGALDPVCLMVLGPLPAAAACTVGTGAAFVLRRSTDRPARFARTIVARLIALSLSSLVWVGSSLGGHGIAVWLIQIATIAVYLVVELVAVQTMSGLAVGRSVGRLIIGNAKRQMPLLLAQASAAALALIVFETMGAWSLLLVVALLLLIRQSYALLLDIRETYRATIEVLIEAAEGVDSHRHGHAERTAQIAREIAARCGASSAEVERISLAALLHDIGDLGADSESGQLAHQPSSAIIQDVKYFSDVAEILRLCDGLSVDDRPSDNIGLAAFIVALASDIDRARSQGVDETRTPAVARVTATVSATVKSKAVGAAVFLGYPTPAVA